VRPRVFGVSRQVGRKVGQPLPYGRGSEPQLAFAKFSTPPECIAKRRERRSRTSPAPGRVSKTGVPLRPENCTGPAKIRCWIAQRNGMGSLRASTSQTRPATRGWWWKAECRAVRWSRPEVRECGRRGRPDVMASTPATEEWVAKPGSQPSTARAEWLVDAASSIGWNSARTDSPPVGRLEKTAGTYSKPQQTLRTTAV